ncbi:ABC-F family ATP-binding cassette domain-containing protein [Streptomyces sp. NPDC051561]|uniref:ABC-F family ATP-binding cassette domain-containing protein n=1 Tax=Streptomyces sp. NPDC051561 TaxID=3365658 RepID=UPI00379ADE43
MSPTKGPHLFPAAPTTTATPATPASQLAAVDLTKRYVDQLVLDRASFTVRPGEKVGVVGDNGSGKSTLLRLLAGQEHPDNGALTVTAPGGTAHLAQTLDLPPTATVGDAIDLALADLRELERRIAAAEATLTESTLGAYDALLTAYDARGGADADRLVDVTLRDLGEAAALDRTRPLGTLSGGQRSRLALAAALSSGAELLLLDEPTNDLDDTAVRWLENRLRAHRGTVVTVTHDRAFLERVTSTILEVDGDTHTVHRYGDGYPGFLAAKAAARARWAREHEEWKAELARHSALAESNGGALAAIPRKGARGFSGAGAFRARSRTHGAMSRIRNAHEQLHRLTTHPVPPPPEPLRFTGRIEGGTDGAVELTDVRVAGRLHLPGTVALEPGARLLLTGPNGAGKSTLLDVLAGRLAPDSGTVVRPARVGHLRQDTPPGDNRTARTALGEQRVELLLDHGLLSRHDANRPLSALSVGQRRKLALGALIAAPVDLLLLDEPTNHYSPALVEELEAALATYPGTLVIASHDRRLRERFTGDTLTLGAR